MKKTLIALTLLSGLFATTAVARQTEQLSKETREKVAGKVQCQAKSECTQLEANQECDKVANAECEKAGKAYGKRHHGKKDCCDRHDGKGAKKERRYCDREGRKKKNPLAGITLTDAQREKVEKAREKQKNEIDKARASMDKSKKKARESFMKEMQKILTPEQYAQFKANLDVPRKVDVKSKDSKGFLVPGKPVKAEMPKMDYQR